MQFEPEMMMMANQKNLKSKDVNRSDKN